MVLAGCLTLVAGGTGAQTLPSDPAAPRAFAESIRLERARDFTAALAALEPLPRTYAVELRLGWLHYFATNHTASATHYEAALALAPRSVEARLGLLLPRLAQSRFADAELIARDILHGNRTHYLAQLRLATALRLQRKFADADRVLARALRMYPSDPPLLAEMGLVKSARNELAAARAYFNEALTLDPDNDVAFTQFANPALFADLAGYYAPSGPGFARPPGFQLGTSAAQLDAVAYCGWIEYEGSAVKQRATVTGVAGWLGVGAAHVFEGGLDFIDMTRLNGAHLHQHDLTLAYSNLGVPDWKFRVGGHVLLSDDAATDGGWIAFLGADRFTPRWNAGADVFFTRYGDFAPSLDVVQVSPHWGWNFLQGADWSLRNDVKAHWIALGYDPGVGRRNFFSAEERVSLYWRQAAVAAFGWMGRQAFGVRGDGAVVFNLAEQHTAGCGIEFRFATSARTTVALRVSREEFREFGAAGSTAARRAAANSFLAFIGMTF